MDNTCMHWKRSFCPLSRGVWLHKQQVSVWSLITTIARIIGASLSEPHIDEKYMRESYIYICGTSVTHAALYKTYRPHEILSDDKSASRKNNCGPRGRRRSCKQASATQQTIVIMLSKEQTVI